MAERSATTWGPDTCDCVVEYFNDDQSFKATVSVCPKHEDVADTPAHLAAVLDHNVKRNLIVNELRAAYGLTDEDRLVVEYDRAAPKDNDPVIIRGLDRLVQRRGLNKASVSAQLAAKFQGVKIEG